VGERGCGCLGIVYERLTKYFSSRGEAVAVAKGTDGLYHEGGL
jgi:hypothetical protein